MRHSKYDIVLIRHAQSLFNEATIKAAHKLGLDSLSWDQLIQNQQFNKLVTYNQLYMDPPLSQHGRNQCQHYRQECQKINPDLILVSPYRRALETCNQLFKNCKSPVFVEPILSQVFRFSCDVPQQFQNIKKSFPRFDFNKVQAFDNEWFLLNLTPDFGAKIKLKLSHQIHEQNRRQLLQLLSKKQIRENAKMLRERAAGIKKMLREYKNKYDKIVVIAHYYIIEFIKSRGFDENDELTQYNGIMNCHPYYENLHQLQKII